MRSFGLDLIETGHFFASLLLIGGTAGVFCRRLARRPPRAARPALVRRLPAIAWLITAPTCSPSA